MNRALLLFAPAVPGRTTEKPSSAPFIDRITGLPTVIAADASPFLTERQDCQGRFFCPIG